MRARILASALLVAGVALAAVPARALPFTGTFVLRVGPFGVGGGPLPPLSIPGSGTGDPTLPSISANAFVGSASVGVTGLAPVTQLFFDLNGNAAGTLGTGPSFFSGMFTGGAGSNTGNIFFVGSGLQFFHIVVPFAGRLGSPGATAGYHSGASITADASFGAWTQGIATISRSHTGGTAACVPGGATCPTAMLGAATANASSFGGAAQIVLVAPINLWSSLTLGAPTFAVVALNYVPEPGSLLLLGSGVLGLAIAGRRRRR